jgi:hypothetical protein
MEACRPGQVCDSSFSTCVPDTPPECVDKNECDFLGQKLCMTDIKYRKCKFSADGCLVWDCST